MRETSGRAEVADPSLGHVSLPHVTQRTCLAFPVSRDAYQSIQFLYSTPLLRCQAFFYLNAGYAVPVFLALVRAGGVASGRVVAAGPPERIVQSEESYTGQYLARHLCH